MSSQTIARRYATALADVVVAREQQRVVQDELIAWELMIRANAQLLQVFSNPTIPYDQKRRVLDEILVRTKVGPSTANFLQTLLKNQRLTELTEINKKLAHVLDERAGVVSAHVTTARPVSEDTKKALHQQLVTITGNDVRLTFAIDEALIGGMVTRVGSTVYDGSIRNQLHQMGEKLVGEKLG